MPSVAVARGVGIGELPKASLAQRLGGGADCSCEARRDVGRGGLALLPAPYQAEVAPSVTCHNNDFFDVRITLGYYEYVATDRNLERGVAMPGTSLCEFLPASERDLKG